YELVKSSSPTSLKLRGVNNVCYTLLKIKIDAGKFHQIRTQLSLAGMHIVGDVKYGGEKWGNDRAIALCATGLAFQAATEEKQVKLSIDIPDTWLKYLSTE